MTKKRKCSHKHARTKGLDFERSVASDLRMIGFIKAGRHLEFQQANAVGVDIDHTGPIRIQCKNMQQYASMRVLSEIKDFTGVPVLVTKAAGAEPCVGLPWKFFLELLQNHMKTLSKEKQLEFNWHDVNTLDLGF